MASTAANNFQRASGHLPLRPPALHVAVNAANNRLVGYSYDANWSW